MLTARAWNPAGPVISRPTRPTPVHPVEPGGVGRIPKEGVRRGSAWRNDPAQEPAPAAGVLRTFSPALEIEKR